MNHGRDARAILLLAGCGLLAVALVYNEFLLGLLIKSGKFGPERVAGVRCGQLVLAGAGAVLLMAAWLAPRLPSIARLLARPAAANLLLLLLSLLLPTLVAETMLRPFAKLDPLTTLYRPDPDLGWRHQPGSHTWGGAAITINEKGLRGRELPYPKPPGAFRILWLGDSVLAGDKVPDDAQIFPQRVEERLGAGAGARIETVNAGVSGYSPWQAAAWLEKEGLRYAPDLIVVVFVPNDVTELLELTRFGGHWEGWQLGHTSTSRLAQLVRQSSIVYFARKLAGRVRFGADTQGGARATELLEVRALIERPDDPRVRQAWKEAFEDLGRILETGRAHGVPVAIVAAPFRFQLEEPALPPTPQETLARWARERGVPFLDLLPDLRELASANGLAAGDLFIDHCHFTVAGHAQVARLIADWLASAALAPATGQAGPRHSQLP